MNRKGDVPVAMLNVIALGLVLFAGFAYATTYKGFGSLSQDYSLILSQAEINENYITHIAENAANNVINMKDDSKTIRELFITEVLSDSDSKIEGLGNYFGKIRNGEFSFEKKGEKYYLEINGLFVQSVYKNSKMTRNFNITKVIG